MPGLVKRKRDDSVNIAGPFPNLSSNINNTPANLSPITAAIIPKSTIGGVTKGDDYIAQSIQRIRDKLSLEETTNIDAPTIEPRRWVSRWQELGDTTIRRNIDTEGVSPESYIKNVARGIAPTNVPESSELKSPTPFRVDYTTNEPLPQPSAAEREQFNRVRSARIDEYNTPATPEVSFFSDKYVPFSRPINKAGIEIPSISTGQAPLTPPNTPSFEETYPPIKYGVPQTISVADISRISPPDQAAKTPPFIYITNPETGLEEPIIVPYKTYKGVAKYKQEQEDYERELINRERAKEEDARIKAERPLPKEPSTVEIIKGGALTRKTFLPEGYNANQYIPLAGGVISRPADMTDKEWKSYKYKFSSLDSVLGGATKTVRKMTGRMQTSYNPKTGESTQTPIYEDEEVIDYEKQADILSNLIKNEDIQDVKLQLQAERDKAKQKAADEKTTQQQEKLTIQTTKAAIAGMIKNANPEEYGNTSIEDLIKNPRGGKGLDRRTKAHLAAFYANSMRPQLEQNVKDELLTPEGLSLIDLYTTGVIGTEIKGINKNIDKGIPKTQGMATMPPADLFKGRIMKETESGIRYKSDGMKWIEIK